MKDVRALLVSLRFLALAALAVLVCAPEAHGWWNDTWEYRRKIGFDTTPTGADIKENLTDVVILLRLHPANFDFTNAKEDGTDIRFVSSDDSQLLKHHIEKFDPLDEMALVWVKVPRLSGGSNQDFIWMYYGNEDAMGGQDPGGTYTADQVLVYHLHELQDPPQDQTDYNNHAGEFAGVQGLPSVIGNGITLNGVGDRIVVESSPSLDFAAGFTFSAWVRIPQELEDAYLITREQQDRSMVIGIEQTKVYCQIRSESGESFITEKVAELSPQAWHHLVVSAEPEGKLHIYVDGTETYSMELPIKLPDLASDVVLGSSAEETHFFLGDFDEIRLANKARSAAWVRATYGSEGPEGTLISYGVEELGGGGGFVPSFYLATVVKNITLDGWVIIGILMIFSMLSWAVFLSKAYFLYQIEGDNKEFLDSYSKLGNPTLQVGEEEDFAHSSLYRIYAAGQDELQAVFGNPNPSLQGTCLTAHDMNTVKASLEKAFVKENQRLNSWLVILTMAITGGPFLGLLGTVWGVMNTFAAMAEAGEANIMAIAPGVASALSTTVFGLIVAIPALFAYNYLASKIKNISADMDVFVEDFSLKIQGAHGGT
jgi:biopolymer transport protein ExbB